MRSRRTRIAAAAAAIVAVVLAAFGVQRWRHARVDRASEAARSGSRVTLQVPDEVPVPSLWVDVHAPRKIFDAVSGNAWVRQALAEPLGEGFLGSWSGFLQSRGEDLKASFSGELARFAVEELLSEPFRVVWFGGASASGAPALVLPNPSAKTRSAHAALLAAAGHGSVVAARCPGPRPPGEQEEKEKAPIVLGRIAVAEHAIYEGSAPGRIVLGRHPLAVLQALCAAPPAPQPRPGVDFDLAFSPGGLGREAQLFAELLGLGPTPRLAFAVDGTRVVPVGIAAELARPERLDAAALPERLLEAVPEETGIVMTLALRLPRRLDAAALRSHFAGNTSQEVATRQAVLLWNPRGDDKLATEVALVWSEPADAPALREAFSGPNRLSTRPLCGGVAFASTDALLTAMARACSGKAPSLRHAAGTVVAGLSAPASLGLGVNLGRVLPQLLSDAYAVEAKEGELPQAKTKGPPPELESARKLLEDLPFLGMRGVAREKALLPAGYRS